MGPAQQLRDTRPAQQLHDWTERIRTINRSFFFLSVWGHRNTGRAQKGVALLLMALSGQLYLPYLRPAPTISGAGRDLVTFLLLSLLSRIPFKFAFDESKVTVYQQLIIYLDLGSWIRNSRQLHCMLT